MSYPITVPSMSRRFVVTLTLDTLVDVTPLQVQDALLKALKTRAFGIPGQVTIAPFEGAPSQVPLDSSTVEPVT